MTDDLITMTVNKLAEAKNLEARVIRLSKKRTGRSVTTPSPFRDDEKRKNEKKEEAKESWMKASCLT